VTSQKYAESAISEEMVAVLLESLTPVDRSILRDLAPDVVRRHSTDLLKRLAVAAEITAPGRGSLLIDQLVSEDVPADRLLAGLDAILEFGMLPECLSESDRAKADRGEIRQEVQHFDRIMDLESLTEGRLSLKSRRDMVNDRGPMGACERLLVLLHERLVLAGRLPMQWQDLAAVPQSLIERSGSGSRLRRTSSPVAVAVCSTENRALLGELERYLVCHPLAVGLGLLDYSMLVNDVQPAEVAAAALRRDEFGGIHAAVWAAATASWVLLDRDGHHQRVLDRGVLDGMPAGGPRTRLAAADIAVPATSWLLISLDDGMLGARADLEAELNKIDRSGRIALSGNLDKLLGERPYVLAKASSARTVAAPRAADADAEMNELASKFLRDVAGLHLSIECGHVHADRELGPAQLRGLDIGARFVSFVRSQAVERALPLNVEITPMVDDDHVLSRLSFAGYRDLFRQREMAVDELILESSPMIRAVAHDVLRRALQRDGEAFRLRRVGNNLYLEAEHLRLELIEDLPGEMRNGCVMFEVGLIMYRAARAAATATFYAETGVDPSGLHHRMATEYDAQTDPIARERCRAEYERLYPDPWETVEKTFTRTPFLDAYIASLADCTGRGERTVVFNVLEDYYRPQQVKVIQLAELLAFPLPLSTVFFSPHGRGVEIFHSKDVFR
jgi:hypothetical protein